MLKLTEREGENPSDSLTWGGRYVSVPPTGTRTETHTREHSLLTFWSQRQKKLLTEFNQHRNKFNLEDKNNCILISRNNSAIEIKWHENRLILNIQR